MIDRIKALPYWALILFAVLLGFVILMLATPRQVALLVNGEARVLSTRALTVRGALRAGGIDAAKAAEIQPGLNTFVTDQLIIQIQYEAQVHVVDGHETFFLVSSERQPADWLANAGIELAAEDIILVQGREVDANQALLPARYYEVVVRRAADVQGNEDGQSIAFSSAAPALGEALYQQGMQLRLADQVDPGIGIPLSTTTSIEISTARPLTIQVGDDSFKLFSAAASVGGALAEAGMGLQALDVSVPAPDQPVPEDGVIRVVRVREEIVIDQKLINFETQFQALPEVDIDTQQVVQAGQYGVEARRVRVRYEDGAEVDRVVEDSWVAQDPVPRIEGYGSKITVQTLSTPDGVIEYWRALEFYATSYSPSRSGVSPEVSWYGHVYCGGLLQNGFVGVDLDYVPCGTQLYIPGYGYAVAMDTGNIQGAWIDLGFEDDDYQQWNQFVTVYFLTPVPPLENIAWIIPPGTFY